MSAAELIARIGRLGVDGTTGEHEPIADRFPGRWSVYVYLVPGLGLGVELSDSGDAYSPAPRIEVRFGPFLVIAIVETCLVEGCNSDAGHFGSHEELRPRQDEETAEVVVEVDVAPWRAGFEALDRALSSFRDSLGRTDR